VEQGSLRLSGGWVFRDIRSPLAACWSMPPEARLQPWFESGFCLTRALQSPCGAPCQAMTGRLVLTTTSWPRIRQVIDRIQATMALIETGGYVELLIP
jgi:hypothetical protein